MKFVFKNITDEKVQEAVQAIIKNGGTVWSDQTFSIQGVRGRYGKQADNFVVIIDDKPWLASWSMIENKLNEFFK